jgi:hypothetical protein
LSISNDFAIFLLKSNELFSRPLVASLLDFPTGFGGVGMLDINPCRIDAKLSQSLDNAIANFERSEKYRSVCPIELGEKVIAAQVAWIEHKMTCQFCCGQQLGRVH